MGHRRTNFGDHGGSGEEIGILTEVDTYDCITFLPMSDGTGAYNRHFGRLNTSKMKIREKWPARVTLRSISTKCNRRSSRSWLARGAWGIYRRYLNDLDDADIKQLAIHKRVSN